MGDLLINGQRILDGGSASQTNDYTAGEGSERISARHHPRPHVVKIVVGKPSFDRRFNVREIVLRPGDEKVINGVTYKHEI